MSKTSGNPHRLEVPREVEIACGGYQEPGPGAGARPRRARSDTLTRQVIARRREPTPGPLYEVFWKFACERQEIYLKRVRGCPAPWTEDPILQEYRFTNVYRAADRVSQDLLAIVLADPSLSAETLFLRTLLFKIFNRTETWNLITEALGEPDAATFDFRACDALLSRAQRARMTIYSGAYIMPSGGISGSPKHRMHLKLLAKMLAEKLPSRIAETRCLRESYELLLSYNSLGPFLAYQYAIDLNYTHLTTHDESEFVVPGPGALDGLSKCFTSLGDYTPSETIHWVVDHQDQAPAQFGLTFQDLWGRSLKPIDVQNIFCEVSKYTRASHPTILGESGRTRIKRRFTPSGPLPTPIFPAKWGLRPPATPQTERQLTFSTTERHGAVRSPAVSVQI